MVIHNYECFYSSKICCLTNNLCIYKLKVDVYAVFEGVVNLLNSYLSMAHLIQFFTIALDKCMESNDLVAIICRTYLCI